MYKKCENCYKDGKTPNEESCRKCEDDLKAKEQECEKLKLDLIEAKAHGDYLNNLALSKTLDTVSGELDQLKAGIDELKKQTCGFRPELKHIIDKTCCKYNINAKYYHEKIVEIINNLDKYKQTLIDIIKIAEEQQSWNDTNWRFTETEFEVDIFAYNRSALKQILQKVSECGVIPDEN